MIEEFVLREGTDYGHADISLEQKVSAVMKQIERGTAQIVFNAEDESCTIVPVR